jgi:hypothetical protein
MSLKNCNRRTKNNTNGYTKEELIKEAMELFNINKTKATKYSKEKLCELVTKKLNNEIDDINEVESEESEEEEEEEKMNRPCGIRKSKNNNAYSRTELIKLLIKRGKKRTILERMKLQELCSLYGLNFNSPTKSQFKSKSKSNSVLSKSRSVNTNYNKNQLVRIASDIFKEPFKSFEKTNKEALYERIGNRLRKEGEEDWTNDELINKRITIKGLKIKNLNVLLTQYKKRSRINFDDLHEELNKYDKKYSDKLMSSINDFKIKYEFDEYYKNKIENTSDSVAEIMQKLFTQCLDDFVDNIENIDDINSFTRNYFKDRSIKIKIK